MDHDPLLRGAGGFASIEQLQEIIDMTDQSPSSPGSGRRGGARRLVSAMHITPPFS